VEVKVNHLCAQPFELLSDGMLFIGIAVEEHIIPTAGPVILPLFLPASSGILVLPIGSAYRFLEGQP